MIKHPEVAIIIPVYDEEQVIAEVLSELKKNFDRIICVNDGSKDNSLSEIEKTSVSVLNHLTNIGQGGALETGIKYALLDSQIKYFCTFDADGQHQIKDAINMISEIEKGNVDIVIGSRFLDKNTKIPFLKKLVLKTATIFTKATVNLKVTDTHNGLRVFNRKFAEKVDLKNFGMAHATEFLEMIVKYKFKYKEIPVHIEYSEYAKSKGQPILNAVNIVFDLIFRGK